MSATPITAALCDIPRLLNDAGYGEFVASFPPHVVPPERWQRAAACIDGELRSVVGLFLLGETVELGSLPPSARAAVGALAEAGVCTAGDSSASLPGLVLVRLAGSWLLAHRPQMSPTLYVGDDSLALAHRLFVEPDAEVLDLCSGPGIQALVCAPRARRVVASEINPVASAIARVNVAINSLSGVVETRCGDLYHTVPGERFDLVVANPPLLPIPDSLPYPFVGHGGHDGLDVVRRILAGLNAHLTPTGRCQLLGTTLSDGFLPLAYDELASWCASSDMDAQFTITCHAPADASARWTTGVGATIAAQGGIPVDDATTTLAQAYRDAGASHICFYFLSVRRGGGRFRVLDVSPETPAHAWFV